MLLCCLSGDVKYQKIGPFTLRYTIDKLDDEKQFQIDFGASVCPNNGDDCIFDIDIIQDYRVPIPFCNSNFSLSLPGMNLTLIMALLTWVPYLNNICNLFKELRNRVLGEIMKQY